MQSFRFVSCSLAFLMPCAGVAQNGTLSLASFASASSSSVASLPDAPDAGQAQREAGQDADAPVTVARLPVNILRDQVPIFTSPLRFKRQDLKWFIPLAAATGAALGTDHITMRDVVTRDPSTNQASINASNAMVGGLIAAPVALFGYGHFVHDERARETGLVGGEAMVDGVIVEQVVKLITFRERPNLDNGRGLFYKSAAGANGSFPSAHSVVAWSSAAVIADRYHSPWAQLSVYTLATGVSLTRVIGQEHFPSDVLVGSAAGWLIGHYVSRHRHRAE